jgi:hypothetical protein
MTVALVEIDYLLRALSDQPSRPIARGREVLGYLRK